MFTFIPDPQVWGLIFGALLPLLVAVVQQPGWSNRTRQVVAAVASFVVGILTVLAAGQTVGGDALGVVTTVLAVFTAAEAFYQKVWQPSGIAPAIERSTTRGGRDEPAFD